ncbi:hypothetical protein MNBD_GAMMA26-925 [hydrothermal vent metagenome]|uniref:Uncharacterized protein n=1 Tax=hydrothermal vent metagenome TaxID=652676 RepID=A0A3B1B288_9ZZZZ
MRIEDDVIYFDNLVRPDRDMVGETKPVTARVVTDPFQAANAPGDFREIDGIEGAAVLGGLAATRLKELFD